GEDPVVEAAQVPLGFPGRVGSVTSAPWEGAPGRPEPVHQPADGFRLFVSQLQVPTYRGIAEDDGATLLPGDLPKSGRLLRLRVLERGPSLVLPLPGPASPLLAPGSGRSGKGLAPRAGQPCDHAELCRGQL